MSVQIEEVELALLAFMLAKRVKNRGKKNKKRSIWVKEIFLQREERGAYNQLVRALRITDRESYFR